ncbi:MAG: nucleoside recognition domain-containing protein [Acidobacteriota bacterium]
MAPLLDDRVRFRVPTVRVAYPEAIETAVASVETLLPARTPGARGLALMAIAGEPPRVLAASLAPEKLAGIAAAARDLEQRLGEPPALVIARSRIDASDRIVARVARRGRPPSPGWLARLGDLAMHPLWGVPVAAAVLYAMYLFVGVLGAGRAVDFLENVVFAAYVTPAADAAIRFVLPEPFETWAAGPAGTAPGAGPGLLFGSYGVISMGLSYAVAIVLPIVGFFFLAFAVLEDSGYLPRLAILLNRAFKVMGLNGKAVLPMVLGLGCDTMATLTARILPTRKERMLVTLLLALGVPCSAQLGVVMAMLSALSPLATLVWGGTVCGVILVVGHVAARLLPGDAGDFVLEIPPMRRPVLRNIVIKTVARIEWYLREAVPLFLLGTLILWIADRIGLLGGIERLARPIVTGALGLPTAATSALVLGFLRRDYGAAGLYDLFGPALRSGHVAPETEIQIVVAMVTITLFVPCVANFMVVVKERGARAAVAMAAFIFPFAIGIGAALNAALRAVML